MFAVSPCFAQPQWTVTRRTDTRSRIASQSSPGLAKASARDSGNRGRDRKRWHPPFLPPGDRKRWHPPFLPPVYYVGDLTALVHNNRCSMIPPLSDGAESGVLQGAGRSLQQLIDDGKWLVQELRDGIKKGLSETALQEVRHDIMAVYDDILAILRVN
jgi:hypothetical protein